MIIYFVFSTVLSFSGLISLTRINRSILDLVLRISGRISRDVCERRPRSISKDSRGAQAKTPLTDLAREIDVLG